MFQIKGGAQRIHFHPSVLSGELLMVTEDNE